MMPQTHRSAARTIMASQSFGVFCRVYVPWFAAQQTLTILGDRTSMVLIFWRRRRLRKFGNWQHLAFNIVHSRISSWAALF
jgi:hypothetical protein